MNLRILFDHLLSRLWPVVGSLLIILGFLASILWRGIVNRIRDRRSADWPRINGAITTTNVRVIRAERGELAFAELGYSYQIDGNYCSGYFKMQFPDEQAAWSFVDQLKRHVVLIRYNPKKPHISILRAQDQGPGFQTESILSSLLPRAL